MYLYSLAVNCPAVKWTGCQMSHGQLSGGQSSRGQMAAVKCRGPSLNAVRAKVLICLCRNWAGFGDNGSRAGFKRRSQTRSGARHRVCIHTTGCRSHSNDSLVFLYTCMPVPKLFLPQNAVMRFIV